MNAHASEEYFRSASSYYEPEYTRPADLTWLDSYKPSPARTKKETVTMRLQPLLQFPGQYTRLESSSVVPMPLLRLVPKTETVGKSTRFDLRARISWHAQGLEEALQALEGDPGYGSWDVVGPLLRLRKLHRELRRRERNISF